MFCDSKSARQNPTDHFDDIAGRGKEIEHAADQEESLSKSELESAVAGLDFHDEEFGHFTGLHMSTVECGADGVGSKIAMYTSQDSTPMSDFSDSSAEADSPDGHISKALANRLLNVSAGRFGDDLSASSSLTSGHLHLPSRRQRACRRFRRRWRR